MDKYYMIMHLLKFSDYGIRVEEGPKFFIPVFETRGEAEQWCDGLLEIKEVAPINQEDTTVELKDKQKNRIKSRH